MQGNNDAEQLTQDYFLAIEFEDYTMYSNPKYSDKIETFHKYKKVMMLMFDNPEH